MAALTFALAAACGAADNFTAAQTALYNQCETSPPATQVRACSTAIDSKAFKGMELAGLHVNRANAYDANGDKGSALKDYNRALELAAHYSSRKKTMIRRSRITMQRCASIPRMLPP